MWHGQAHQLSAHCTCTLYIAPGSLSNALWGWISLVQNHKCCAHGSLYKFVMTEREVVVRSADEGQQARNSYPELGIFFSWHHMVFSTYVCTYWLHCRGYASIVNSGLARCWPWPAGVGTNVCAWLAHTSGKTLWFKTALPSDPATRIYCAYTLLGWGRNHSSHSWVLRGSEHWQPQLGPSLPPFVSFPAALPDPLRKETPRPSLTPLQLCRNENAHRYLGRNCW